MEYGKCRGIERGMGRRDFLKAATLLGATAAGAGMLAGCAPKSASEAQAQTAPAATGGLDPADVDWKYETDVVIVGSGSGGTCAAIEAAEAGADVVVF